MELQRDESLIWSYSGVGALEHTVKVVCAGCNNGWMSALEVKGGEILRPMLRAERVGIALGYSAQVKVASWATKTAMVLHHLHPADSFIPSPDYREFYRRQQPSSDVFVMLGARHIGGNSKGANLFEYKERFLGKSPSRGIHHVHFAIGALYFGLTMFVGRRRAYPRAINEDAAGRALIVWPVQPKVIWPSPSISEVGGVDGMFDAWATASWP